MSEAAELDTELREDLRLLGRVLRERSGETGARQGEKRSKLGQLASICNAVWRRLSTSFLQRISDSGH